MTDREVSEAAAQVRQNLFSDYATREVFGQAINKSERTVWRMEKEGLPTIKIGATSYVILSKAKEWLAKRHADRHAAPRRGRPPGRKAA